MDGQGEGAQGAPQAQAGDRQADAARQPQGGQAPDPQEQGRQQEQQGGPKGQPSMERQLSRLIAEALAPINERLARLDGSDPQAAQQAVADTKADLEALTARHEAEAKRWAVERALLTAGCIDTVGCMAHVDMDKVALADDGEPKGFDAESLKRDLPHLFQQARQVRTVSTGAAPAGGEPPAPPSANIAEGVAAALRKG